MSLKSLSPARRITAILPVLILVLLVGIAPFFEALRNSLYHDSYGERSFAGLNNFRYILGDAAFGFSLNITVLWAFLNVLLSLIFGFLLALALVHGRKTLYPFLLVPMAIPVYIAIPLWRAFLHGNGGESVITRLTGLKLNLMMDPFSGFIGALLVSLWLSVPLTAFVFAGHMRKVNRHVLEAARIEGAGTGFIAVHIYIPEIRDSLAAMGVLNFIKSFKEFTLLFMMTAGGPPLVSGITGRHIIGATSTLGVFLYEVFLHNPDWGVNAAYSVIMAALVLVVMLVWAFLRRKNPLRPILILLALVLVPGGNPFLWSLALAYLVLALLPRKNCAGLLVAGTVHLGSTIFQILNQGFLAGFHPGIAILLFLFLLIAVRPDICNIRDTTKLRGGFRRVSFRGMAAGSGLVMTLFILVTVIILYLLLWMSLSRVSACYMDTLIPRMPTLENYRIVLVDEGIGRYFFNTFLVAGITALVLPFVVFTSAVFLDRAGRKQTLAFLALIQIVGMAGGMHTLIPLYGVFRSMGLLNTYIPLILIYLYHSIPFSLFILTAFFGSLPSSFRDLARMEGVSSFTYGFRILLPLSLPQLFTAVMMAFISAWNGFQAPLLFLNDEQLYTISLKLYSYVGSIGSGGPVWNLFAAASVINTLFIGALFIRFRKPMTLSPISEFDE